MWKPHCIFVWVDMIIIHEPLNQTYTMGLEKDISDLCKWSIGVKVNDLNGPLVNNLKCEGTCICFERRFISTYYKISFLRPYKIDPEHQERT